MFWLIVGAIWLYCAARVLAFVVALGWATASRALRSVWAGVLWAAGRKQQELQQEPQPQQSDEWWLAMNAQAGESRPAAGYAGTASLYRDG
jgi:hypothetical protein